ncbi:hypothetical protein MMG00_01995 [Ignatzschineria rhizosphaerae]|uniref:DUF3304 domain-containing protein n=1 Tax=Ignatzschineria rhizosphaerae TaxID=2923279 RepID=A0ABY3X1E9_9GAMM|nr:hypothetical protein [Ignatzschineria rhizosphaerae]UNM96659.1 hypothetical protein MMG00_01995 [Ignatzschineria rhizosphaerae]
MTDSIYRKPKTVTAPKGRLEIVEVLWDGGAGGTSVIKCTWDGNEGLGMRWNGFEGMPLGNPTSHDHPTWFILPDFMKYPTLAWVEEQKAKVSKE